MRSVRLAGFAAVMLAGLAGLILTAARDEEDLAFTLGVNASQVAAVLKPGQEACQRPIYPSADAAAVRFQVGTFRRAGPPLEVRSVPVQGGAAKSSAVPGGYADNSVITTPLSGVREGPAIGVCVRNAGRRDVALHGGAGLADRASAVFLDGKKLDTDLTLVFERAHPRSMLSALPDMFDRAALWRPGAVGPWVFWLLLGLVALAAPLLLGWALAASERVPGGSYDSRP
jgi:hypothetical protein